MASKKYKIPISVLVVVYTKNLDFLLLERKGYPNYWQSVTGSIEENESLIDCSVREVYEEIGVKIKPQSIVNLHRSQEFEIFSIWRHRYHPKVSHNLEHWFSLMIESKKNIIISKNEHSSYQWCNTDDAIAKCFSWTNKQAIQLVADQHQKQFELNQ